MLHPFRLIYIAVMLLFWRAHAFEKLGPSFIKLGQTLSTRPDLIGAKNAAIFAELRDNLPPFPSKTAMAIIDSELGAAFSHIENIPVAAASIAQVHRAKTLDGHDVAIKILRPGIEKKFKRDLDFFMWTARRLEQFMPRMRRLKPVEIVRTLQQSVLMELDLRFEAANACELKENTKNDAGFRVPTIDWALTTGRVLVLEWVDGVKLSDIETLKNKGHDLNQLLTHLSESFFMQAFRDGFFHADMHPGNIFVDNAGTIVVVDFGIMGRLDWQTRLYVAEIFRGFLSRDFDAVARAHFNAGYVPKHHDVQAFASACRAIAMPILDKPVNEISIGTLLGQLFQVTKQFEMQTRPELLLFQKTLVVVEGIGCMLNPSVNMWELARAPIESWGAEHLGVCGKAKELLKHLRELIELAPQLLRKFEESLQQK